MGGEEEGGWAVDQGSSTFQKFIALDACGGIIFTSTNDNPIKLLSASPTYHPYQPSRAESPARVSLLIRVESKNGKKIGFKGTSTGEVYCSRETKNREREREKERENERTNFFLLTRVKE